MPTRTFNIPGGSRMLDARPDRLDLRDLAYLPPVKSLPPEYPTSELLAKYLPKYIKGKRVLNQGQEGACTGFGLAATINYMLWWRSVQGGAKTTAGSVSPYMLYDLARFYDEWPGEDYDGSSCRGAMKGWHKHGVCEAGMWTQSVKSPGPRKKPYAPDKAWPEDAATRPVGIYYRINHRSVTDMQAAIHEMGAIYVAASVHPGWSPDNLKASKKLVNHRSLPVIPFSPSDEPVGGHAFALVGYNDLGFVIQNSWGETWGNHGFAILTYADWVRHGADAWVCSLGVPQAQHAALNGSTAAARTRQLGSSLLSPAKTPAGTSGVPVWTAEEAYGHTVVAGNDGIVRLNRPDFGSAEQQVNAIALDAPLAWHKGQPKVGGKSPPLKLMIYAHGGLNSEEDSIKRIQRMAPYFLANGVYPIFYTWRTGFLETIGSAVGDAFSPSATPVSGWRDAVDSLLESLCHGSRFIWSEMKENARIGAAPGHGIDLLAAALKALGKSVSGLEVHLVGHSAGSFVHGHLIKALKARNIKPASLTLYAPACPLTFANEYFQGAVNDGTLAKDRFWLHVLSDKRERSDTVGPYHKSLLYLVSRGFESSRKTPLAGLAHCIDASATDDDDDLWTSNDFPDVLAWRNFVNTLQPRPDQQPAVEIVEADKVPIHVDANGKTLDSTDAAHGAFDNDVSVITHTINRILGAATAAPLPVPVDDMRF